MLRLSVTLVFYVIGRLVGYSDSAYTKGCQGDECNKIASSFCGSSASPASADYVRVSFTLHNRDTGDGEQLGYNNYNLFSSKFNKDFDTVFLVHGFKSSSKASWMGRVKEELLKKGDYNVIFVDWNNGAGSYFGFQEYVDAARNTETVGSEIANFCIDLVETLRADFTKFHLVGFSLGAHAAGFAGWTFHSLTNKLLPRITGLDPAGPCFEGVDPLVSLDRGDADFVDVIHTGCNGGGFGIKNPIGHADFYPSGCRIQPGCLFDFSGCNHKRATELFIDSIQNEETPVMGSKCSSYSSTRYSKCPSRNCAKLGYYAPPTIEPKIYCLQTSSRAPFGRQATFRYWIFK